MKTTTTWAAMVLVILAATALVAGEPKAMPKEILQYLQGWAGEYSIEGTSGDKPVKGRLVARLARGRHANLYDWSLEIGGEAVHLSSVEGWDTAGGWTIEQGVASDGEVFTVRWTRKADNLWVGEGKGVVDGQPTSNTVTIEKTPDGFNAKTTDNKRGSETRPDSQLKYTRLARKTKDAPKK